MYLRLKALSQLWEVKTMIPTKRSKEELPAHIPHILTIGYVESQGILAVATVFALSNRKSTMVTEIT